MILDRAKRFIESVDKLEVAQQTQVAQKEQLEKQIEVYNEDLRKKSIELDEVTNAVNLLRIVSDDVVKTNYKFIEQEVNATLAKIFEKSERKIILKESTFRGQYPQLEIELHVENGTVISLEESGHGLEQIVSLLCTLCLIMITGGRRLLIIDEVLSGLSAKSRMAICEVLNQFTAVGFQFVVCEHGLIPKGSNVIHLGVENGVSSIKDEYIAEEGTYLDNKILENQVNVE